MSTSSRNAYWRLHRTATGDLQRYNHYMCEHTFTRSCKAYSEVNLFPSLPFPVFHFNSNPKPTSLHFSSLHFSSPPLYIFVLMHYSACTAGGMVSNSHTHCMKSLCYHIHWLTLQKKALHQISQCIYLHVLCLCTLFFCLHVVVFLYILMQDLKCT